jgi:hypothetical protein
MYNEEKRRDTSDDKVRETIRDNVRGYLRGERNERELDVVRKRQGDD